MRRSLKKKTHSVLNFQIQVFEFSSINHYVSVERFLFNGREYMLLKSIHHTLKRIWVPNNKSTQLERSIPRQNEIIQ